MLFIILIILLILILFIPYFKLRGKGAAVSVPPEEDNLGTFPGKLSSLIQIPTVSWTDESKTDVNELVRFQKELSRLFPLVHEHLETEIPDPYSVTYKWTGTDPEEEPVLFLAHYDVVPAEQEGGETWTQPPFSGAIEDGFLWGRGTLDIKSQLAFLMETAERLLEEGFTPRRTIYFAFGGDEEISGLKGAQKRAETFGHRGLKFAMIMDEGGVIARNMLKFLGDKPAALIGLAEKGFVTFRMTVSGESGHSSMPPAGGTVLTTLAKAIARIESKRQPAVMTPQIRGMLKGFVPWVSLPLGLVFSNLRLFGPLVLKIFAGNKTTDSLIRTTQAFTVARAGEQENVIPGIASCLVNHRIIPGDTIDILKERHQKRTKGMDLKIEDAGNWPSNNPIEPAPGEERGYNWVKETLKESHPEAAAVPFLVNGSTDSKYYRDLTGQIVRFTPLIMTQEDISSIHGVNEKVSLVNLNRALGFYRRLFQKL